MGIIDEDAIVKNANSEATEQTEQTTANVIENGGAEVVTPAGEPTEEAGMLGADGELEVEVTE